ncbi:MAG: glycosyltransferase [Lachnospiraceae bacterium]|nr:glycosyltransferase [Lachnospiraceae bacterium]
MKKKLLYWGHDFHKKTKSTAFLIEMLSEKYDVDLITFDPYKKINYGIEMAEGKAYDVLVCFQIMPRLAWLLRKWRISYKKGVFFPMYDSMIPLAETSWLEYLDFTIINFSKTLHENLLEKGFNSYYVQYFPKPAENIKWGNDKSLFIWQRKTNININTALSLCAKNPLEKIHLHKTLDPFEEVHAPEPNYDTAVTYSEWFDEPRQLYNIMMESSLYLAPRLREGIGMGFLEAMAMGRCVIAPNNPTMNEYIENGVTGYLYDFDEPKAINFGDIRAIQEKAYEYIAAGYEKWQRQKANILYWIEEKTDNAPSQITTLLSEFGETIYSENKFRAYFSLLSRWLILKNSNRKLSDFFIQNNYLNIAIYGMGEIGERLSEELKDSKVNICYAIDSNIKSHPWLRVISLNDPFPKVDLIVVTPFYEFELIKEKLLEKSEMEIISINDIIMP